MKVQKGTWVRIHRVILKPEERAENLPEDTAKVPLEAWTKGFLMEGSETGENAVIQTLTGRTVSGTLVQVNPTYDHGFGEEFIPEILYIGRDLKKLIGEGSHDEG
ncbi:2-amino-4-oxopentanoate thiolase subunit OrtA [Youngiibacter multivorans]|uniref:2-amino-4-ketopentanoate thiolase n=1 Tax=Youngiibacter multivorans TaxID=937251 RepID=A0ABS4G2T0_9CLOT|nr:hypothetical protein [Youngiibacter multivorans]